MCASGENEDDKTTMTAPAAISWPDAPPSPVVKTPSAAVASAPENVAATRRFDVPFELIKQTLPDVEPLSSRPREPVALDDKTVEVRAPSRSLSLSLSPSVSSSPSLSLSLPSLPDEAPAFALDDFVAGATATATAMTGESTGSFRLDDFLSSAGDTLMLGDPLQIVETSVLRSTSGEGVASDRTETRICIGADIEAMLGPTTVLGQRPDRPAVEMSGFETFVFGLVDGVTPVSALAGTTGLSSGDLRIALALLADKGQLVVTVAAVGAVAPLLPVEIPDLILEPLAIDLASIVITPVTPDMPVTPVDDGQRHGLGAMSAVSRSFGPVTVLRAIAGADLTGLSAFERHVLTMVDGSRSVMSIVADSGLTESDVKMALELLNRRGVVEAGPMAPRVQRQPSPPPAPVSTTPVNAAPTLAQGWLSNDASAVMSLPGQALVGAPKPRPPVAPPPPVVVAAPTTAPHPVVVQATPGSQAAFAAPPNSQSSSSTGPGPTGPATTVPANWLPRTSTSSSSASASSSMSLDGLLRSAERAEGSGNMAQSVLILERAAEMFPSNPMVLNRLGVALARSKNLRGALTALGKALDLKPNDPTILSNFKRIAALAENAAPAQAPSLWDRMRGPQS